MADDDAPNIYTDNLSRAGVTGKVPSAKGGNQRSAPHSRKSAKVSPSRKSHAKRLRKRGLISTEAATRNGL